MYLRNNVHCYSGETDYSSIAVFYYTKIEKLLFEYLLKKKGKIVIFVSSKKKGQKLYEEFKKRRISVALVTAENKENEASETVHHLVKHCKFRERVLITTSVLDVGVNIKDGEVAHVVTMIHDRNTFIQMIGRIRQGEDNPGFNLYIAAGSLSEVNNMVRNLNKIVVACSNAVSFESKGELMDFMLNCYKDQTLTSDEGESIFSDHGGERHINRLARYEYCLQYNVWSEVYTELQKDRDSFIKKQFGWLGKEEEFCVDDYTDEDVKVSRIKKAICKIVRLSESYINWHRKKDNQHFLELCKGVILDVDKSLARSDTSLSINKFNKIFQMWEVDICIEKNDTGRYVLYRVNIGDDVLSCIEDCIEEDENEEEDLDEEKEEETMPASDYPAEDREEETEDE